MDTQKFKEKLLAEKARLEEEMKSVGSENPDAPGDWEPKPEYNDPSPMADRNDAADAIIDFEENAAVLQDLETQYSDVKRALEKIEKGEYGVDEIDGEPIPEARLEANPSARTKVENANKIER